MGGCFLRLVEGTNWSGQGGAGKGLVGTVASWELWVRKRKTAGDMEEYGSRLVYSLWKGRKGE